MTNNAESNQQGALSHLRIIEYGDIPASYAARWLGDLGADVIKVEPPGGDPNRHLAPFAGNIQDPERSLTFINANLNKRSVVLDINDSDADRQTFADLLAGADAFIEATPPGTLESLDLTQEALLEAQPPPRHHIHDALRPMGPLRRLQGRRRRHRGPLRFHERPRR